VRPLDEYELRAFFNDGYDRLVGRLDGWSCQPWAEDLVQEALLRAWERARGGEAVISLHAWVTTVATNLARSQLRRQQAERRAMARLLGAWPEWLVGQTGAAADLIDDHVDELRELLAGLPRRQREVLVLHYVADLDVASIAKLLGIGVGTVKSSLSRGRQAIVRTVRTPAPATTAKEEAVTMGLKYWRVAPSDYEFGLAEGTFEGRRVASLRSTVKPARDFGACRQEIAADDYRGKRIRFAAALKAVEVTNGWAGLWLRVDGAQRGTTLAFDNMEDRAVKGHDRLATPRDRAGCRPGGRVGRVRCLGVWRGRAAACRSRCRGGQQGHPSHGPGPAPSAASTKPRLQPDLTCRPTPRPSVAGSHRIADPSASVRRP
jgi:RNA polymerase sigma factor (sigma-70 family)